MTREERKEKKNITANREREDCEEHEEIHRDRESGKALGDENEGKAKMAMTVEKQLERKRDRVRSTSSSS